MKTTITFLILLAGTLYSKSAPPRTSVDIKKYIPDAVLDIRYATTNNFIGKILNGYKKPYCWLRPKTAAALVRVQRYLRRYGYGLKIFDGYRPLRARIQMIAWARKQQGILGVYIGSNISLRRHFGHNCGNTVDLTLIRLSTKKELDMGTAFDYFGKQAWTYNARGKVLRNRMLLLRTMCRFGFTNYSREWWHFVNYRDPGPVLDIVIK